MRFRPGKATDLLCPEPQSTTGRAIASLSLRKLNDDVAQLRAEAVRDERARAALVAFRRELDALLPGRPKERVAILASPFVRAPLERALYERDEEALVDAAIAGLFAFDRGPGLSAQVVIEVAPSEVFASSPLVRVALEGEVTFPLARVKIREVAAWTEGEMTFAPDVAGAFALEAREPDDDDRARAHAAFRLLDAGASTEVAELHRFFHLAVPIRDGVERRPGALGVSLGGDALAVALRVVEALAAEKLARYGRLLELDVSSWAEAARAAVRWAFLERLEIRRHPISSSAEYGERRQLEQAALPAYPPEGGPELSGVVAELDRLLI
jgi:hypothetical protein